MVTNSHIRLDLGRANEAEMMTRLRQAELARQAREDEPSQHVDHVRRSRRRLPRLAELFHRPIAT
jgi:hypothetical protein